MMTLFILDGVNRAGSVRNLIFYLWHAEAGFHLGREHETSFEAKVSSLDDVSPDILSFDHLCVG